MVIAKNFVSRTCPIRRQDQIARARIRTLTANVTARCENSINTSAVISFGIKFPLQSGQFRPQPRPLSVFVTRAPPSKIINIPSVESTERTFNNGCIFTASPSFLYLVCSLDDSEKSTKKQRTNRYLPVTALWFHTLFINSYLPFHNSTTEIHYY